MSKLYPLFCSLLLILSSGRIYGQEREVLFAKSPSVSIQEAAKILQDRHTAQVPLDQLHLPDRYFVRITERRFVLTDKKELVENASLAGPSRSFAFLTTPQGFYGKSLVEIYGDIGYEAEQMIASQQGKEMVAILFRYEDNVPVSPVRNGELSGDWRNRIYPTTWDNMFSLFARLVQDKRSPACTHAQIPSKNICLSPADRAFVLRFPQAGKQQLKKKNYAVLQATGGSLWRYRKLLEDNLSMFEHFRGDGRTENEIVDLLAGKSEPRLYEVVGPNFKLADLAEMVIIRLGKMIIDDCFSATCLR